MSQKNTKKKSLKLKSSDRNRIKPVEQAPEAVIFVMYCGLAVLAVLVVLEVAIISYWLVYLPPSYSSQTAVVSSRSQNLSNSRLGLELSYRQSLREIRKMYLMSESSDPSIYKKLRDRLADLPVPPSYRNYHLNLVILLDKIITKQLAGGQSNSSEQLRELSVLMDEYQ